jgi:hypothetical protein
VDLAGDGYFYDPGRSEAQGWFFFCFAEDGSYVFFRAFRNYLAAVVEGEKTNVFTGGPGGVDTAISYERSSFGSTSEPHRNAQGPAE